MPIHVGETEYEVRLGEQEVVIHLGDQLIYPVEEDTRGWWIHYQTGVKTYFDATADFIDADGVMGRPYWINNAKEIRLCAGITDFSKQPVFYQYGPNYTPSSHSCSNVFWSNYYNPNLEKVDFGDAQVSTVYVDMLSPTRLTALTEVVLNDSVTKLEPAFYNESPRNVLKRITIPSSVVTMENGNVTGTGTVEVFGGNAGIETIYTDVGNTTALQALLNGKGLPSGYQIVEV